MKKNEKFDNEYLQKADADMHSEGGINTDPLGSWTGVPDEKWEAPVQDADDL